MFRISNRPGYEQRSNKAPRQRITSKAGRFFQWSGTWEAVRELIRFIRFPASRHCYRMHHSVSSIVGARVVPSKEQEYLPITDKPLDMRFILPVVIVLILVLAGTAIFMSGQNQAPVRYTYRVIATYPHDPDAFTEGLAYYNGSLVESTGPEGNSTIRLVNLTTGIVTSEHHLPNDTFAEGATVFGDRIAQETETSGIGIIYNVTDLRLLGTFPYSTIGWGITYDGRYLIMSDGSSSLYFLDPGTFRQEKTISVTDAGKPVQSLNELEYVNGEIYANVWPTYRIARISPEEGNVTGWIDLTGIVSPQEQKQIGWSSIAYLQGHTSIPFDEEACPNGIAYDATGNRLFVTGKLWPQLYEIDLVPVGR